MKGKQIIYSKEELDWISNNRTLMRPDLHRLFCEEFSRVDVSAINIHSLRTRNGWKTGRTGQFKKGNIPHPNARPKGANRTSFKKGNKPHGWKPLGSSRFSKDGYIEIKISEPRTWALLHIMIWIAANGKIPEGHCVVFKNGDKTIVEINNLELITRNENLQINRLQCSSRPLEVRPVVRAVGKLVAKTNEMGALHSRTLEGIK